MKKYTLNNLKGILANGKTVRIHLEEQIKGIPHMTAILIRRMDVLFKDKFNKETYSLLIEKFDSRYHSSDTPKVIEIHEEFNAVEEVIIYLVNNKFIKREDLIEN